MNAMPKFALAALAATCIVTEAQAMRWYSPHTGRWLSRDPIEERGGQNLLSVTGNDAVNRIDVLGLRAQSTPTASSPFPLSYNWGTVGDFITSPDSTPNPTLVWTRNKVKGDWMRRRPGDGEPCCVPPAQHHISRIDNANNLSTEIEMKVNLYFTGGPHDELVLLWDTCYTHDFTVDIRRQCNNSTSCSIPVTRFESLSGNYQTGASISYLSCENEKWTTKTGAANRNYFGGLTGWTWIDFAH
jgi:hypothetical protein